MYNKIWLAMLKRGIDMSEAISKIKEKYNLCSLEMLSEFIENYKNDDRKGVQTIIKSAEKKIEAHKKEELRLEKMSEYENKYFAQGIKLIAGVDEVGRGPLAGPVVTAAVILPQGTKIEGINDSKKLSEKKREELFEIIKEKAVAIGIGIESNAVIDEINILQATYSAMRMALNKLEIKPEVILVDAVTIPQVEIKQEPIIKGDAKSISIAAASIIAKVTRDRMMTELDEIYSGYGFKDNKGYGSAFHINAIKEKGLSPIHRKSFTKNFV